jgi:hypothetical protein
MNIVEPKKKEEEAEFIVTEETKLGLQFLYNISRLQKLYINTPEEFDRLLVEELGIKDVEQVKSALIDYEELIKYKI